MLEIGNKVRLNNNEDYIVIGVFNAHNLSYVCLISMLERTKILVAIQRIENGKLILKEVKNKEEREYILSRFPIDKIDDSKD